MMKTKKLYAGKIALYGLLLITLIMNAGAVVEIYNPNNLSWTSDLFPSTACSYGPGDLIYFGTYIINRGAGTPCMDGANDAEGYSYIRFSDLTPALDVKLNCTVFAGCGSGGMSNGGCSNTSNPLLYRIYGDWNNDTLTWNTQPAYCEGESCWNARGGIEPYIGDLPNIGGARAVWDITGNNLYGGDMVDLESISFFLAEVNGTGVNTAYTLQNCVLQMDGLYNYSTVNVNVFDNFAGISNLEVSICNTDYSNCAYKFTDSNGLATFSVSFGTYIIATEYSAVNLSYQQHHTFSEPTETVYIYFNSLGAGSISGFVYWPNGTGVDLAYINLTNLETGASRYSVSRYGAFNYTPISKGNYSIYATKYGRSSEIEFFTCVGDDSINLHIKDYIDPLDGYDYTIVNISVYEDATTPLPGAAVERWWYIESTCPEVCFQDSYCRNTNCHHETWDDKITNSNGLAIMNHMPPAMPLFNQFYIYAFKSGYIDDYRLVTITGNYTPVHLYLSMPPNTTVNLHETHNLSGISVKVIPNMGAAQQGFTNTSGDAQFTFTSVISSLIVNATTTNPNYMNKNFIFSSLAGNPINKDFTLPIRSATSFNVYGFCIDNVGNLVDGAQIELDCTGCDGAHGNPYYCGEYSTQGGGLYSFTNIKQSTYCSLKVTGYPGGYAHSGGGYMTFYPTSGDNYFNLTNCMRLIGQNLTPSTIYLQGNVIEGTGRMQSGLTITSGPFLYSINGSGYMDGMVSNGILYIDDLGEFSNVTIKFDIPDYEKRIFRIGMGNNNYDQPFTLDWIGVEETSTTEATTTFPIITTTIVTTTLVDWNNYTIYEPSNETMSLFDNAYIIVITVATSICGFTTAGLTLIIVFVGICMVLLANQVLKALGFKWDWLGF